MINPFAPLLNNWLFEGGFRDSFVTRKQAAADLVALRDIIRDRHSYVSAVAYPYERAIDAMTGQLPEQVSVRNLASRSRSSSSISVIPTPRSSTGCRSC